MTYHVHDYFTSGPVVAANIDPQTRIFVVCVWEASIPESVFLQQFYNLPNPVTLVLNSWARHIPVDSRFDVFYVDFFLWRSYNEILVKNTNAVRPATGANNQKFLFLTGKPEKKNRIDLLYDLEQASLTDRAVVSLFINPLNEQRCREQLAVSSEEFDRFVAKFNGSPDGVRPLPNWSIHYGGIPYDTGIFDCKFRLIAETNCDTIPPWITEKTWITVLNRRPFIIAGDAGTCERLQHMGFSTFDNALVEPYDTEINWDNRKKVILRNVAHWLDSIYDFGPETEHNYNQLITLAKNIKIEWQQYCDKIGLELDIDQVIDTSDPQAI